MKLSQDLNINKNKNIKFFLLELIIFPKFGVWIPLFDIKGPNIRWCISQVFIYGEPEIFQTDNGTEFRNKYVEGYIEAKNTKFIHGRPNHPKYQSAVEVFNKTVQNCFSDCKENGKTDGIEWDLKLILMGFWIFIIRWENIQRIWFMLKFLESTMI